MHFEYKAIKEPKAHDVGWRRRNGGMAMMYSSGQDVGVTERPGRPPNHDSVIEEIIERIRM